jgi:hypothetical protein
MLELYLFIFSHKRLIIKHGKKPTPILTDAALRYIPPIIPVNSNTIFIGIIIYISPINYRSLRD